jgi:hypothetical protein
MSGVAGADRVKSRQDFKQFLTSYQQLIAKFPGFISLQPSGSYNSNPDKMDFGDIDLIVHIQSTKDKAAVKKELQTFFHNHPDTVIVPFSSEKHAGKRSYNAGELVSVRYHDDTLGYSAQIDNIVALDQTEASFKQEFLDLPAEKQGLILGLVKIAAIETQPQILFKRLGITARDNLEPNQEYEFNLSSVELQLRLVTYEPGTYKQADRQVLWTSRSFDDLKKLLYQYKLDADFDSLLLQAKQTIKNPRSNARMEGVFSSMITVKSGEVGTAKGAGKEAALAKIQQTFKEHRSLFRSLLEADTARKVVFAFVRFQPPTIGHELLINTVKKTAEQNQCPYVIYVSRKQDHKENPLNVETKIQYLNMMFPGTNFIAAGPTTRTPIEAAVELNQKYTDIILVAGSDRESMFNLLQDYNHKNYEYNSIEFVSAGDRDPDSPGVAGISGTKMREAAVANDFATFQKGLPDSISAEGSQQLMSAVAAGLQKPARAKKGVAEARSNLEQNIKYGSGKYELIAFAEDIRDKENWAVTMTAEPKLGINPQVGISEDTPKGIYFYPLQYFMQMANRKESLPWGNNMPYMQLFQYDRSAEMTKQTQVDPAQLKQALSQYCSEELIQQVINDPDELYDGTPYWIIYDCLSRLGKSDETNIVRWNKVLRDLGFTSVFDPGAGWIAYNEPTQGVVLDPRIIKQHKMFSNRNPTLQHRRYDVQGLADAIQWHNHYQYSRQRERIYNHPDEKKVRLAVANSMLRQFLGKNDKEATAMGFDQALKAAADKVIEILKQGVAEGKSVPVSENIENIMNALINKIIVNEAIQNNRK